MSSLFPIIEGSVSDFTTSDPLLAEAKIKWHKPVYHPPNLTSSVATTSTSLPQLLLESAAPAIGSVLLQAGPDGSVLLCILHLFVNLADLIISVTSIRNAFGIVTSVATLTSFDNFATSLDCPGSTTLTPTSSSTTNDFTPTPSPTSSFTSTTTPNIAATAGVAAAVAVALAAGVGVGVAQAAQAAQAAQGAQGAQGSQGAQNAAQQAVQNVVNQVVQGGQGFANPVNPIPMNALPFFVLGASVEDDSCGDGAAKGVDGTCVPVLKTANCPPMEWITVDPEDLTAKCGPRICGNGRIFMASDGLCHDVYDARDECPGGRRLYYSAFGDPICDCPVGEYPFPTANDTCVRLFTRGPCPVGEIVRPDETGNLTCTKNDCPDSRNKKPMAMAEDGSCYQLGTRGPCNETQVFAFDIFQNEVVCDNVTDENSPYFLSVEEQNELDKTFGQLYPYNEIYFWYPKFKQWLIKKQSEGIFQLPTFQPDPALAPCRPGSRNGNNIKCTNPLSPRGDDRRELRQAVRPSITCRPGQTLSARGDCRDSAEGASCGPSYEWNAALRRCTQSRDSLG